MGSYDVAFLPLSVSFYTTFQKNSHKSQNHMKATYIRTVAGGKQGQADGKKL